MGGGERVRAVDLVQRKEEEECVLSTYLALLLMTG